MLKTKQKLIESALAELKKEDDVLLEMANIIREDHPEIPANIFISPGRGYPHGPRIKVQTNHDASVQDSMMVPITISDRPQLKGNQGRLTGSDLRYFYEWIVRNKDVLLAYWNGTMQIERVLRSLQY